MSKTATIAAEVGAGTLAAMNAIAVRRGLSVERLASDLLDRAAVEETELQVAIAEGRRQIAAGEGLSHEQLVANLRQWRLQRKQVG